MSQWRILRQMPSKHNDTLKAIFNIPLNTAPGLPNQESLQAKEEICMLCCLKQAN